MRRYLAAGAALLVAISAAGVPRLGSAQSPTPWPTFHGNQLRDGTSSLSGPTSPGFANVWQIAGPSTSSPAVDANGTAYLGDNTGNVYAFNPKSPAAPVWTFKTNGPVLSSPTISKDGSTVFVGSDDGTLYALSATGKGDGTTTQLWGANLNAPVRASPLLSNDGSIIFIPATTGQIYALSAKDGSTLWSLPVTGSIPNSLALSSDGQTIYAAAAGSNIMYGIPAGASLPKTSVAFYLTYTPVSTPAIDQNGNIYVGTSNGDLDSFTPTNPAPRWVFQAIHSLAISTSPTFAQGQAILGSANGYVYDISLGGTQNWQKLSGPAVGSSPVFTAGNNHVYIGSDDGNIYCYDVQGNLCPVTGNAPKWPRQLGVAIDSSPAVAPDGSLWVTTQGSQVYRIKDVTAPPTIPVQTSPTPGPSSTPTATPKPGAPTATPGPTFTATATATPSSPPVTLALKTKVKAGSKQVITVTSAPNTVVHLRVEYPNGDHQSKAVTTDAGGKAVYSYKQGASKITHKDFTATVTAKTGTGSNANVTTVSYLIQFGSLDVSAEPRTIAVGKTVDIFVHAKPHTSVQAWILTPKGKKIHLHGKTGPKGFASLKYKIAKGLVSGTKRTLTVMAQFASGGPTTTTTFTIK